MTRFRTALLVIAFCLGLAACADQTQSQSVEFPGSTTNNSSYSPDLWNRGKLFMESQPQPLPKDAGIILAISSEANHWTALFEKPDGSIKQIRTYGGVNDAAGMRMLVGTGDYVTVKSCCGDGIIERVGDVKILQKQAIDGAS